MPIVRLPVLAGTPLTAPGQPMGDALAGHQIADTFGRKVSYLRISLTDRCNYRCTYCMTDDVEFRPRAELLTFEEIVRLVGIFAGRGVRRIRLTGGEPTVRNHIVDLVAMVAAVPGIEEVVMTSNGHLLTDLAGPLAAAGLRGVNVSIDTLDPDRFRQVTRRGELARVVAGIDAARAAGIAVKLNAVALHGVNHDEIPALCSFAWERGTVVRFIEHMPMSGGRLFSPERELPAAAIRVAVEDAFGPLEVSPATAAHRGPSRYWRLVAEPTREVGIISAMTDHFCDSCNRLRLTATGELHACLGHDDAVSLRDVMRTGGSDTDVLAAIAVSVTGKRSGHEFLRTGVGGPTKHMVSVGG